MKLTVLGCDGAFPAADGACSGYLLERGETRVLLDCGPGVLARLTAILPPEELSAVVLSHLHYDHMSDMLPLIYRILGKTRLPVYAPVEPAPVRALLADAFDLRDIAQGGQIGEIAFTAFPVRHPMPCWATRYTAAGKSFCYTGDTNTCDGLADFVRGCDLLLIDACFTEDNWNENKPHLSARLAAELAAQAGVKGMTLTHFVQGNDPAELLTEARRAYPRALAARPGLTLTF